ncbi:MAG: YggT family protein [Ectothiorhodospira sp.]
MSQAFQNAAVFLIGTLFSLYILAVLLRTLLALSRADFYNPISQFLVTVTNPPLRFLRRFIPPAGRLDTAALVLALVLQMTQMALIALIHGVGVPPFSLLMVSILELLRQVIWIYIISIIIQAVMSWFQAGGAMGRNPAAELVDSLNRPLLDPIRRVMPRTGMVDLSPLVALLGLNVLLIFLGAL